MLSDRILQARQAKGLTQKELADATGCSLNTIHVIEAGKLIPSADRLRLIAKALRVPVDELFELAKQAKLKEAEEKVNERYK